MYSRGMFMYPRAIVGNVLASTDSTSWGGSIQFRTSTLDMNSNIYGQNYMVTLSVHSTGSTNDGIFFHTKDSTTVPTSTNGFFVHANSYFDVKVPNSLNLIGNSTSVRFSYIVWDYKPQ